MIYFLTTQSNKPLAIHASKEFICRNTMTWNGQVPTSEDFSSGKYQISSEVFFFFIDMGIWVSLHVINDHVNLDFLTPQTVQGSKTLHFQLA
jgi:hypothetical protein